MKPAYLGFAALLAASILLPATSSDAARRNDMPNAGSCKSGRLVSDVSRCPENRPAKSKKKKSELFDTRLGSA